MKIYLKAFTAAVCLGICSGITAPARCAEPGSARFIFAGTIYPLERTRMPVHSVSRFNVREGRVSVPEAMNIDDILLAGPDVFPFAASPVSFREPYGFPRPPQVVSPRPPAAPAPLSTPRRTMHVVRVHGHPPRMASPPHAVPYPEGTGYVYSPPSISTQCYTEHKLHGVLISPVQQPRAGEKR